MCSTPFVIVASLHLDPLEIVFLYKGVVKVWRETRKYSGLVSV